MDTNCLPLCPGHVGKHSVRKQCARRLHRERQLCCQWLRRNRATTLAAAESKAFALVARILVPDLILSGCVRVKTCSVSFRKQLQSDVSHGMRDRREWRPPEKSSLRCAFNSHVPRILNATSKRSPLCLGALPNNSNGPFTDRR